MLRYASVVLLSAVLLFVVGSSLTGHSGAVSKSPVDVQMDRNDVANVSKPPVSSIAISLIARTEISVNTTSHPGLSLRAAGNQPLLQKQQYVFRI